MTDLSVIISCPVCEHFAEHAVIDGEPNGIEGSADVAVICSSCGQPFDCRTTIVPGVGTLVTFPPYTTTPITGE